MRRYLEKLYFLYHDLNSNQLTNKHPRYKKYNIGDWTYGFPRVYEWGEGTQLIIGKFCSIARDVKIYLGGEHRMDWVSTFPFSEFFGEAKDISSPA